MDDRDRWFKATSEPLPDTKGMARDEAQAVWALAAQKGCSRALDLLLKSMHVLIWHEARRWVHSACGYENGHYLDDVIAECRIAIFKKLWKYDSSKGSVTTFCMYLVKGACSNYVFNNAYTVHIPAEFTKRSRVLNQLLAACPDATNEELSEQTGISVYTIDNLRRYRVDSFHSTDEPRGLSQVSLGERIVLPVEEEDDTEAKMIVLKKLIKQLPDRQRFVIENRFGFAGKPKTLKVIGDMFGFSRERTRQIEGQAIENLRQLAMSPGGGIKYKERIRVRKQDKMAVG